MCTTGDEGGASIAVIGTYYRVMQGLQVAFGLPEDFPALVETG